MNGMTNDFLIELIVRLICDVFIYMSSSCSQARDLYLF